MTVLVNGFEIVVVSDAQHIVQLNLRPGPVGSTPGFSAGVRVFYRAFGLEPLFRDVQAARYHPLPEAEQVKFSGEYLLRD